MKSPLPFISSKVVTSELGPQDEFGCFKGTVGFLLSEIECAMHSQTFNEGYLAVAQTLLMLTRSHPIILKKIIFYGTTYGLRYKNLSLLMDVLIYVDLLFQELRISASDRLSLCSVRTCINFELYSLTGDIKFLFQVVENYHLIKKLLEMHPQLQYRLGWEHFSLGIKQEEISLAATATVYQTVGKSFLALYHKHLELYDLTYGIRCLAQALTLNSHAPDIHADYAKGLVVLGTREGKAFWIEQSMKHFSQAIFLSFTRAPDSISYQNYRYSYALAAVKLFDVTYKKEHFYQATQILYQTLQSFPHLSELWIVWGELLIRSGWLNSNVKHIEAGLEKLASIQKKSNNPIVLSSLLAMGISILGLYLEEPNLFKESRLRLISAMKAFPGNSSFIYALGTVQLCSALYFNDNANFASAVSCFLSCVEWDFDSVEAWQKLFDGYFSWGVKKKSARLLQKAVDVASKLCSLRPEAFLFWSDRGLALKCLAEVTVDEAYKEIFLIESLLYYRKAWDLSHQPEIIELWGYSYYLLAELQEDLTYYNEAHALLSQIDSLLLSFRAKIILAATLLEKGRLLEDLGSVEKAEAILLPLLESCPQDENILLLLGKVYLFFFWKTKCIRASKLAKMYLEQAASLGSPGAYLNLGKFYSVEEDIETAWEMILRSIRCGMKITETRWLKDPYLVNLRTRYTFHEILENQRGRVWQESRTEVRIN
ncbi:hypothetical protein [Candidatus Chlamydia sanziniae]